LTLPGRRRLFRIFLSVLLPAAVLVMSLLWGRYPRAGFTGIPELLGDEIARSLIWNLRLPRIIMAILTGASLAAAGQVLQTVLGNPLVEPGFLGVSQGAAFGAALAIVLSGGNYWPVSLSAALFGLTGLAITWLLARNLRYGGAILRLVLSGIVVSAFFSSGLGILKYLADPLSGLPEITFWMMGGLGSAGWLQVIRTAPPVIVSLFLVSLVRWRVNLLSLDDRSAFALGSNPGRERLILIVLSVAAVAAVTAAAGIISWVGLLIPHISRRITGADTHRSLPLSMALGAVFVLVCDDIARGLLAGEIPLGLLTALAGAISFALLMVGRDRRVKR
jgi:iron complex transport system permease protein